MNITTIDEALKAEQQRNGQLQRDWQRFGHTAEELAEYGTIFNGYHNKERGSANEKKKQ